jgi:hypothetical protein
MFPLSAFPISVFVVQPRMNTDEHGLPRGAALRGFHHVSFWAKSFLAIERPQTCF